MRACAICCYSFPFFDLLTSTMFTSCAAVSDTSHKSPFSCASSLVWSMFVPSAAPEFSRKSQLFDDVLATGALPHLPKIKPVFPAMIEDGVNCTDSDTLLGFRHATCTGVVPIKSRAISLFDCKLSKLRIVHVFLEARHAVRIPRVSFY